MSDTEDTKQGLIDAVEGDKAKGDATDKKADDTPKFTQADLDRLINERLARADKAAKDKADKAAKEAEEKALAENAKWQELAEKRGKEVETLNPYKERAEAYEKALLTQLESVRKQLKNGGVSDTVLDLLNAKPPAEQLEYIAQKMDELLPQEQKGNPANVGKYPPSGKSNGSGKTKDQLVSERKKTGIYGM